MPLAVGTSRAAIRGTVVTLPHFPARESGIENLPGVSMRTPGPAKDLLDRGFFGPGSER
jgi:hypothetical protein